MITLGRLMKQAITLFEENAIIRKKISGEYPEIRNVLTQEMSIGRVKATASFRIEYAINGDYTESDTHPTYIDVVAENGRVEARWDPYLPRELKKKEG